MCSAILHMESCKPSWNREVRVKSYMRVVCTRCICSSLKLPISHLIEIDISLWCAYFLHGTRYNINVYYIVNILCLETFYLYLFIVFRVQMINACVLWPRDGHSESRWPCRHHVPCSLYYWLHCVVRCLVSMWTLKIVSDTGALKGPCSGSA